MTASPVHAALLGVCVGDALGVPVEFRSRGDLDKTPVTAMTGYGTYNQPPGTWSDDSSLTLCLAESLTRGYDLRDIGDTFVRWYHDSHWTPHGVVFDAGGTTREAVFNLFKGDVAPQEAGPAHENANGNGSLMRILPMAFFTRHLPVAVRWRMIADVSGLTHGHVRAKTACIAYVEFAIALLESDGPAQAMERMRRAIAGYLDDPEELRYFYNLTHLDISTFERRQIRSSGYVVHTLEAALWSLLTSDSFEACVLKAVNLGDDSDTTGAVTGGLAGLRFGLEAIPREWIDALARREDIIALADAFAASLAQEPGR